VSSQSFRSVSVPGIPFWNTPEYAERVKAENAALEAERAAVIAGGAPSPAEEEPEPFWSGLVTGAAEVKNALAPPVRRFYFILF
jgi:hypothetical protein